MSLLKERIVYKPFEYPQAYDYWLKQQQAHWLHTEVPMANDVTDWKSNMTPSEKKRCRANFKRICTNRNNS